jgi:hypothetical protein
MTFLSLMFSTYWSVDEKGKDHLLALRRLINNAQNGFFKL